MSYTELSSVLKLPDPINHLCSLTGSQISKKHFTYCSVQIQKSYAEDQMIQDMILRARLCGTGLVTHPGWLIRFHQINMTAWKGFVPFRYQLSTGISAGLAFECFCMIHRVGRTGLVR